MHVKFCQLVESILLERKKSTNKRKKRKSKKKSSLRVGGFWGFGNYGIYNGSSDNQQGTDSGGGSDAGGGE